MNFRPTYRDELDVNITPLIDVVFLLLIFFMVSTTFQKESELHVQLPESTAKTEQNSQATVEIVISPQGEYFISGQELVNNKMSTLRSALRKVTEGRDDTLLIIRADGRAPHQSVVTAMDVAAQLGLMKLSFATSQTSAQQ